MRRRKLAPLKSLASIYRGYTPRPSERRKQGQYRVLTGRNLSGLALQYFDHDDFLPPSTRASFQRSILRAGDILLSTLLMGDALKLLSLHPLKKIRANRPCHDQDGWTLLGRGTTS
jgi:hypothetical protein